MEFEIINENRKFNLREEKASLLKISNESRNKFYIGTHYEASFEFTHTFSIQRELELNEPQFKFENSAEKIVIPSKKKTKFKIIFSPVQAKAVNFSLILKKGSQERQVVLLSRTLKVETAIEKIESQIKGLPASMKLGQKAEVIFLFTNSGDQPVNGINIEVKQIEAS